MNRAVPEPEVAERNAAAAQRSWLALERTTFDPRHAAEAASLVLMARERAQIAAYVLHHARRVAARAIEEMAP